eukprot:CAMPEP_0172415004 /NCGR_PEP_ID=MMETSP1064-20121228/1571_1 /TAXON_ID=202472 /ORGANISM="Aulacoseira subarctica , Strain CCAP 1002/5" /LENGTH=94 /DNA_ID=CAMNT_0013151895 /DNA_START=16 /DNA_END=300 /DNA_ORIENTATION=+
MKGESDNEELHDAGKILSECLLSQYQFCVGGTLAGAAYGVKFPTGRIGRYGPFILGGVAGTLADIVYAYNVACVKEVEAERQAQQSKREGKLRQ